jgi:DnaJ-class molecular chaperone
MATEPQTRPCPTCNGTGEEFDHDAAGGYYTDCRDCQGKGLVPYRGSKPSPADAAAAEAGSAG